MARSNQMTGRFRGTKDGTAARQSPLLSEAQKNTQSMLAGMLRSLGFQQVTVNFS